MASDFAVLWIGRQLMEAEDQNADLVPATSVTAATGQFEGSASFGPVAQAASILGVEFNASMLARLFRMDTAHLAIPLNRLVQSGLLIVGASRSPTAATSARYRFASVAIREQLLSGLAKSARQRLHRRAGHMFASDAPSDRTVQPECIARQFTLGEAHAEAFRWWCAAARQSIASAATLEAVRQLQQALDQCKAAAASIPPEDESAALQMLGPLQAQLHGSGSPIVAATYARCLAIAAELQGNGTATAFDVLWGLQACQLVNGAIAPALKTGVRLLDTAMASGQDEKRLLAARMQGLTLLLNGDLKAALHQFQDVLLRYDCEKHAYLRFHYASDQGAVTLAHKALAEAIVGNDELSERAATAALDLTASLDHAHTSAHVTCVLAARAQTLGNHGAAAPLAMAGRAIATRHKFLYWMAWAEIILGWHEGVRRPVDGAIRVDRAIEAYRSTGAAQALPYAYLLRAQLALAANDHPGAIASAKAGIAASQAQGLHLYASELLRIEAEATQSGPEAQRLLGQASRIASRQEANLFLRRITKAQAAKHPRRGQSRTSDSLLR